MCKIQIDLKERKIDIGVRYYGAEDLATRWDVKKIIDNADFFESFYTVYPLIEIKTIDDYMMYLYTLKFKAIAEIIPSLLQEDHKVVINNLSTNADNILKKVKTGEVIKFINEYIEAIFNLDDDVYDVRDVTIDIIKRYGSGIKEEVYAYLCSQFYWLVIDNFDSFFKVIGKNPVLFEKLYPTGNLEELQNRRFKDSLDIFADIYNGNNEELKNIVISRIETLCTAVECFVDSITTDNVMMCESTVREFTLFLQRIKHHKANDFIVYSKSVEKILDEKIMTDGHHAKYEIPVEEMVKHFVETEPWYKRLIVLTHKSVQLGDSLAIVSNLEFEKEKTSHLVDFCSTNIPTDDYFTYSHQQRLSIQAAVSSGAIIGIMSRPEVYTDFAKLVFSAIDFISDKINRPDEHLVDDWLLLDRMLQTIIVNRAIESEALQSLCYGAAMFTCSLMEKLLRMFYVDKVKDTLYVPVEKATLGQLLTENNTELVDVFGKVHIRHLEFFMLKHGTAKIGYNFRNRIAHWSEIKSSMLTVSLVAELMWLFIDVLNTIFVYYIENKSQETTSEV